MTGIFSFILQIKPNIPVLIYSLLTAMAVDFITGVVKAKFKKVERTSEGYRRTVKKITQYFTAAALAIGLQFLSKALWEAQSANMVYITMFVLVFIIYIEVTSIFENLYEIDSASPFAKYFIKPLLIILKFGIKNNPAQKAADSIGGGKPLAVVLMLLSTAGLLGGCMTDRKAERITNDYNARHPELMAKACADKFPPRITFKPGRDTTTKTTVVLDTAAIQMYEKRIDILVNELIAERLSASSNQPENNEQLLKVATKLKNEYRPVISQQLKIVTDTIEKVDSALVFYLSSQLKKKQDSLVYYAVELKHSEALAKKRKKQVNICYLIFAFVAIVAGVWIYFKYYRK
jgi:phage-related holin